MRTNKIGHVGRGDCFQCSKTVIEHFNDVYCDNIFVIYVPPSFTFAVHGFGNSKNIMMCNSYIEEKDFSLNPTKVNYSFYKAIPISSYIDDKLTHEKFINKPFIRMKFYVPCLKEKCNLIVTFHYKMVHPSHVLPICALQKPEDVLSEWFKPLT